ncbi:hypothetical protein CMO93_06245 [Candidatus Woesearchaeota archaeon]|nr:hypothetical protein [Candidatus Woesearchaeota archaeon]|tara:strand:+ start:2028 stop:2666 length:639 start_codon:yes stop_codon:yes gene_type:complete
MENKKDLYNQNKEHKKMKIEIPPNLNTEEIKCFNEIVKPQLEGLYSYSYDKFEFKHVKISISKDKFPDKKSNIEEINNILNKIPKKHLKFVSDIYFVSYNCKDETDNYLVNGRTLPIIYKIIIYPRGHKKLEIALIHEIGHVIYAKKLNPTERKNFAFRLLGTFRGLQFNSSAELNLYIEEQFALCYDNYINNQDGLKEFPMIYNFFIEYLG